MDSVHHNIWETTSLAQLVFQHCGAYGISPVSAISTGDYLRLAQAEMPNPLHFNSASEFAKAYQAYSLLRKFDSFPIPLDRAAAASAGFDKSEVSCGRIYPAVDALPFVHGVPLARQQQSILECARSLIHRAVGTFKMEEFQMACDFSNGSSTRVPRKRGNPMFKLEGKPHVTINCRDLAVHYIWCNDLWRSTCQREFGRESDPYSWVQLVPGSRFDTVPKTSLTDRPICVEPDLNMFFQKGIGHMLKRVLRRLGIDLRDQTRNQRLALKGSITGLLATIDLSSASDSIALRLVEYLLPPKWFEMLMITRSAYVLKDEKYVKLEKISSMGNGYTFELESLIFWALTKATCIAYDEDVTDLSIYGDDIICPVGAAQPLIDVLRSVGFETNVNKTFISGPFRESCGKHYFLGADVTPFKIESLIETWADLYHFCNSVAEWGWMTPDEVNILVAKALQPIPPKDRCYVPPSYSSKAGLRSETPPRRARYSKKTGCHVYSFHYMAEATREHDMSGPYAYLAAMLLREQRSGSERVDDDFVQVIKHEKVEACSWFDWVVHSGVPDAPSYSTIQKVSKGDWRRKRASVTLWCDLAA